MRTRLIRLWDFLRSSYWFLPLCMSVGAVLLADLFLALDRATPDALIERGPLSRFVYVAPAESQRTLLLWTPPTT